MRKLTLLLGIAFLLLGLNSCNCDVCCNVDCGAKGNCDAVDGKCVCDAGFEVDASHKCNTRSRIKFLSFREDNAPYMCIDSCQNTNVTPYQVMLMPDKNPEIIDKIYIQNFRNKGDSAILQLTLWSPAILLNNQIIKGDTIKGGTGGNLFRNDSLYLSFTYKNTSGTHNCHLILLKQ